MAGDPLTSGQKPPPPGSFRVKAFPKNSEFRWNPSRILGTDGNGILKAFQKNSEFHRNPSRILGADGFDFCYDVNQPCILCTIWGMERKGNRRSLGALEEYSK